MLSQKLIVITGASMGLGRQLSLQLAETGARLALIARNSKLLHELSSQLQESNHECQAFVCDLSDAKALSECCEQIHQRMGSVDMLINNAGIGQYKPFLEHTTEEHDQIIDVNFRALVQITYAFLPDMLQKRGGHILNIGSDLSDRPLANMAVYSATKHAIRGFSLSLMREVKNSGIKVSLVNPGIIDTAFNGAEEGSKQANWALQADQLSATVIQVLTQPGYQNIDELTIHPLEQDY